MINEKTDLIPRTTLTEMVLQWRTAQTEVTDAYRLLLQAEARLKSTFKPDSYLFDLSRECFRGSRYDKPEILIKDLKKDVWRALIDRMGLKRILSIEKAKELDRQLETGEGLPEIDEPSLIAMIDQTYSKVSDYIAEAVTEVYNWLRPPGSVYKRNSEFGVGRRVVLRVLNVMKGSYWKKPTVNHYREQNLRALDNVFHAMDGRGSIPTHRGPLFDAVESSAFGDEFKTDYFACRAFKNGNLHIEFLRLDLLAKLNQIAGDRMLPK